MQSKDKTGVGNQLITENGEIQQWNRKEFFKRRVRVEEESRDVNEEMENCADKLDEANRELMKTKEKLSATRNVLSNMQAALAAAYQVAEDAKQRAFLDFTGVPNRELFNDHLEQAIALARRYNWVLAVMFIDLNRFKLINDTYGHAVGDRVLQTVAQRLREQVRTEDTLCRYGGDEFLYLLVNPRSAENIRLIAGKVSDCISQPLIVDDLALTVEPSIGIAVYPDDGETGAELVANADAAMYRAKKQRLDR